LNQPKSSPKTFFKDHETRNTRKKLDFVCFVYFVVLSIFEKCAPLRRLLRFKRFLNPPWAPGTTRPPACPLWAPQGPIPTNPAATRTPPALPYALCHWLPARHPRAATTAQTPLPRATTARKPANPNPRLADRDGHKKRTKSAVSSTVQK
jgi:hypothetical protein